MATTRIYRTPSSASAGTKWTVSMWIKGGATSANQILFSAAGASPFEFRTYVELSSTGILNFGNVDNGNGAGSLATSRVFKDPSAWYHLVFVWDNANATSADKMIIYVNGGRETAVTYTATTTNSRWNMNNRTEIGSRHGGDRYFSGEMSHVHNCDGYAYSASDFGETDSTSGIWKIKTSPSVTYGTNGFFLKMEDRTNLDLDSSSNAHTFTTSGDLTATYDNPSNNFCTMNPLDNFYCNATLTNGNTRVVTTSAEYGYITGTLGAAASKWYWEMLMEDPVDSTNYVGFGITGRAPQSADGLGYEASGIAYQGNDGKIRDSGTTTTYGNTYTTNDIIGIAMDLDNSKLYVSKNGVWQNSGVPTSGATGTGAHSISTAVASTVDGVYRPAVSDHAGSSWTNATFQYNFGNGYFKTDLIASPEADDAGIGAFKYNVPAGFYALCTKNIKAYG